MIAQKYYQEILAKLKANRGEPNKHFSLNYDGNNDPSLHISSPARRELAKEFAKSHKDLTLGELVVVLGLLYRGKYSTEKSFASKLLHFYPRLRKQLNPRLVDVWLDSLKGWCQVDSICQSVFSAEELQENWQSWKALISELAKDKNINKRRASLVLLTRPVRHSENKEFARLGFSVIDLLKAEKEILITKAISWLLRDMVKLHREDVISYLKENKASLPKVAVRETRRKLETGRK